MYPDTHSDLNADGFPTSSESEPGVEGAGAAPPPVQPDLRPAALLRSHSDRHLPALPGDDLPPGEAAELVRDLDTPVEVSLAASARAPVASACRAPSVAPLKEPESYFLFCIVQFLPLGGATAGRLSLSPFRDINHLHVLLWIRELCGSAFFSPLLPVAFSACTRQHSLLSCLISSNYIQ